MRHYDYDDEWDANQEGLDNYDIEWEFREHYSLAEMAEPIYFSPAFRTMKEWDMINTPMTQDEVLDTIMWIRSL